MQFQGDTITQYAPYNAGYNYMTSTLPAKGLYNIGYTFKIPGSSFTGQNWSGATITSAYNIMTIPWNGIGNYTLGVWQVNIVITTNFTATPPASVINWNTFANNSTALTITTSHIAYGNYFSGGTLLRQIVKLDFVLTVDNLTTTYYLNYWTNGGAVLSANLANSELSFTRIA